MLSDKDIEREQSRAEEALERRDQKMEERCGNCRFVDTVSSGHQQIQTVCRRNPPGVVEHRGQYFGSHGNAIWPAVASFDWCGEWQPARQPEKQEGE